MFDKELQVLVSGALIPVNLEDLRRNTNYSGVSLKIIFALYRFGE